MTRNESDEDRPIDNRFIRDHFQWDRMSDVKWDIVRNNLSAAERVLAAPEKFPYADLDAVEQRATELSLFLTVNLR
jgi:hypothetical protein